MHGTIHAAIDLVNHQQETIAAINPMLLIAELATGIKAIRSLASAPELGLASSERARKVIDEP